MRYTSWPALGKMPICPKAYQEDMAPESSLPGRPLGPGVIAGGDDLADARVGFVGTAGPDVEIGREEAGLVAHVVAAGDVEERVEAADEGVGAAGFLDHSRDILGNEGGVGPGVAFVESVLPPQVHVIHGSERAEPGAVAVARAGF